ncbi:MAG: MucR family transcriptional regulator [Methylobacterium sp.]|uniref:MucR family transcriptional regulator n=1 Tax=Methylobacterium sp. TaxID=409 RepID=UPI0025838B3E|nr:MucR family transcriptional regulator [Methylobacterium sp.]MBY0300042.1 MucR family transcriptional regulator [Methylobacterium sp.]
MSDAVSTKVLELAADIVSAYVSRNSVPAVELPNLIANVHAALRKIASPAEPAAEETPKATAAQIRKSIEPDYLISFVDGRKYKSLKRHLSKHGLTPELYRSKFGLPADYPMIPASYSAARSELAKSLGLGQQRRKAVEQRPVADAEVTRPAEPTNGRGRPSKSAAAAE